MKHQWLDSSHYPLFHSLSSAEQQLQEADIKALSGPYMQLMIFLMNTYLYLPGGKVFQMYLLSYRNIIDPKGTRTFGKLITLHPAMLTVMITPPWLLYSCCKSKEHAEPPKQQKQLKASIIFN